MPTVIISTKKFERPQLVIKDSSGQVVNFTVSRVFTFGKRIIFQDYRIASGITHEANSYFSTRAIVILLKDFIRHPIFFTFRMFKTWKIQHIEVNKSQLPLHIAIRNRSDTSVWVSRQAVIGGIAPRNLDNTLELDYKRNPHNFDLMVRASDFHCVTNYDFYSETEYELYSYMESLVAKLTYYEIANAVVVSGRIVTSGTKIILVSNHLMGASVNFVNYLRKSDTPLQYQLIRTKLSKSRLKNAIFIGYTVNWFHFIVECIPRLMEIPEHMRINSPVILPDDAPRQIIEICEYLTKARAIKINLLESITVENLIMGAEYGVTESFEYDFRKTRIQEAIKILLSDSSGRSKLDTLDQRLFIQRPRRLFRPLQNEYRIKKWLGNSGFAFISPEKMDLIDMIKEFSNAKMIVAESGAGITNILFAQSGGFLVELYPGKGSMNFWPELASISGVTVIKVMSKPMLLGPKGLARDGIYIPLRKLKKVINKLGLENNLQFSEPDSDTR